MAGGAAPRHKNFIGERIARGRFGRDNFFDRRVKELAADNEKIIALSADLTRTSGLEQFASAFPDRMYNVGIAEENAIGMAAGLADQGFVPFVTTFANFAALRANEFVRHFMAYMNCNVKLVGLGSGFAMEFFGTTHYGLEDIAVLRSMPNITIFSPADGLETAVITDYASKNPGPVYIRLSGKMNAPIIHKTGFEFIPGKALKLAEGRKAVVYATGSMVSTALKAAKKLSENNIDIAVYDIHTIKPFDEQTVIENKDIPLIVSIEEHCKTGGLGSAVAEALSSQTSHGKHIRLGTGERYEAAGSYEYMLDIHGLTAEGLENTIINELKGETK